MKRILALLIALMLLCGCGAQQTQEPETIAPETAEKTEQIAVTIPVEEDEGYDPYRCMSVFNRMALEWVYEPLFAVTQAGEAIPVLAESWSVSEDGLTTAVTIRSGIHLHSGAVLTAEDVVRSVRRAMSGSFYSGRFRLLSDMTAEGNTVLFQTEQAYECFPLLLDIPISGEIAEGETENGTGAYRMQGARLVRFEDWRGADSLPDAIGLSPVQSPQQLRDRFQYGAVTSAFERIVRTVQQLVDLFDGQVFQFLPLNARCFDAAGRVIRDLVFTLHIIIEGSDGSQLPVHGRRGSAGSLQLVQICDHICAGGFQDVSRSS